MTNPDARTIRAFIGIFPPAEIREKLEAIQHALKREDDGSVRWVGASTIHLTIRFLGDIDSESLNALEQVLRNAGNSVDAFCCKVTGLSVFPNVRRPRVVWAGIQDDGALLSLQKQITAATREWGEADSREFQPHLTLGRVNDGRGSKLRGVISALEKRRNEDFGAWPVSQVDLMQSELTPAGPIYRKLFSVALRGQEVTPNNQESAGS